MAAQVITEWDELYDANYLYANYLDTKKVVVHKSMHLGQPKATS